MYFSGNYSNNGNISGGYRGPPSSQQNYGNNYNSGTNLHPHPPPQQSYYGQQQIPPQQQQQQMYHQPMPNAYQQMGQIPRPMNTPQPLDNRGYGQPPPSQHQMPIQNRS
jgi:hypothetical protein